ncbi:MAG: hypothetical protein AAFQ09_04035 [Pseudomonadota bacterium]
MSITSPAFLLLAVIGILMAFIAFPAARRVKAEEKKLNAEDLKAFRHQYRRPTERATMPSRLHPYANAVDKAARAWLTFALAILAALFWIIIAGPNLGLFGT